MHWWTQVLEEGFNAHATEIYLTVGGSVLMRVDGELVEISSKAEPLTAYDVDNIVVLLLNTEQRIALEIDNFVLTRYIHEKIGRCRVVITRQRNTYSITLRLYHSVERLEIFPFTKKLEQLTRITEGLIIVAGLAHSGRSTICAQLIRHINKNRCAYVVSLEKTLSYLMPHGTSLINQREVGLDISSFSDGIRASVYENADVVVIDDFADASAVDEALMLSMQGRLVILTMTAKNATQVMQQLLTFSEHQQSSYRKHLLQSALRAIVVQRLITGKTDNKLPIYEIVLNNQAVQSLIETGSHKSINDVILRYTKMGMCDFDTSLADFVLGNQLTKTQALTMIDSVSNFEMALLKALP